jgi:hypothetical protein
MAYETEDLKQQAISAIIENDLYFVSDVIAMLPCSKQTFYDHKLDQLDDIKKALEANRINAKIEMRKKWLKSDNATMQMGLMKLLSEDEELRKLAMEYREHGGEIKLPTLKVEYVKPDESK